MVTDIGVIIMADQLDMYCSIIFSTVHDRRFLIVSYGWQNATLNSNSNVPIIVFGFDVFSRVGVVSMGSSFTPISI